MPDTSRLARTKPLPGPGIVHLGPGAFFRAFLAPYTDEAMAASGGEWGIIAVSLKSASARDALAPQHCAYTVVERGPDGDVSREIGAVCDALVATEDPAAVLSAMAAPQTRIVSLTITEKGYCHNPQDGGLQLDHPDIAHDIAYPGTPRSAIGFVTEALAKRRMEGTAPFAVLTCDNLPANGRLVRKVVLAFAKARDSGLAGWIADNVSFPSSMVDRITPATTQADIAAFAASSGLVDPAMVVHEPFRQWVIEDEFPGGRPDWQAAGAQMVADVEPFELMKLRCLNGTHSTLAYLGYLAGHETISDSVADPAFAGMCRRLWNQEILPTLAVPDGEDLPAYCESLLERYRNPSIRHRTWQIAMDGSQKLPQRILGTLRDRVAAGHIPPGLCLAIAGWMRYVGGSDETGAPIDVRDPLAADLRAAATGGDPVGALLGMQDIFGRDLPAQKEVEACIRTAYRQLLAGGASAAVAAYAAG